MGGVWGGRRERTGCQRWVGGEWGEERERGVSKVCGASVGPRERESGVATLRGGGEVSGVSGALKKWWGEWLV